MHFYEENDESVDSVTNIILNIVLSILAVLHVLALIVSISATKPWRFCCTNGFGAGSEEDNSVEESGFNFRFTRSNVFNVNPIYS
uniref:Uncharacterized protein n=1 Tax=Lepeophtheirus salmonis TaxID=72036 RepID=A0A0K2TEK5_LEPSM